MRRLKYDFHPAIDEYANIIRNKEIKASDEIIQLIDILPHWLKSCRIDGKAIDATITKIDNYFDIELLPFQRFILALYKGVRDKDGLLRFGEIFLEMGRGGGKNVIASMMAFDAISDSTYKRYHVDVVANSEVQAKTSHEEVYYLIDDNDLLQRAFNYTKTCIRYRLTGSEFKYRTSNSKTADGGRPGMVIFDEVHAYEDYENVKVHTSGLGKIRDARKIYITTNGYVREGAFDTLEARALDTLENANPTNKMLPMIYRIPNDDEAEDESNWVKSVPLVNDWPPLHTEMRDQWEIAQVTPPMMVEFMVKRMNRTRASTDAVLTEYKNIAATNRPIPDMEGESCIGGVDYASIQDFAAVGLLFKKDDVRYWIHHSFICEGGIKKRKYKLDPYEVAEKGLCTIVREPTIPAEYLAEWFRDQQQKYHIIEIACDTYREKYIREAFDGLPLFVVRSGAITHNKLAPTVDAMFARQKIVYGDDMLMRWYTNNVKVVQDGKGNKSYHKFDPESKKTDGFMALIHAMSRDELILPKQELYTLGPITV